MANQADLDAVLAPIESARGLANNHYVDADTFEAEKKALLFGTWAGIGFGKDVPQKGDVKPISFLGAPLLLLRDRDDQIRVFYNVCRHRGMILIDQQTRIRGAIRCPYHSWCYSLKGNLTATPHLGGPGANSHPALKRKDYGLKPVRAHVWKDCVFVNISGDAPPFEEDKRELLERWSEFEQPIHHGGWTSSFALEANCNWKLAVENYCESYHLPWVHPGLNTYSRLEDHYHIEAANFAGQGTHVYRQMIGEEGQAFPDFKGLEKRWNTAAEYIAVFPNVLMGVHRDHFYTILLEPVAIDRTIEHVEIYYAQPATETSDTDGMRAANAKLWRGVFDEDIHVVEGMQKGRHAEAFDGGKFSPAMDGPTHTFHRWAAQRLKALAG